jgi:hypothetical protein
MSQGFSARCISFDFCTSLNFGDRVPRCLPRLVSKDGLHSSLQGVRQRNASLGIVEIWEIPKVPKVKRNIVLALCDQDHLPPQRVGDARFIENVRVSTCAVTHDDAGAVDKCNHILNDSGILPNVVSPPAPKIHFVGGLPYAVINRVESWHRGSLYGFTVTLASIPYFTQP